MREWNLRTDGGDSLLLGLAAPRARGPILLVGISPRDDRRDVDDVDPAANITRVFLTVEEALMFGEALRAWAMHGRP